MSRLEALCIASRIASARRLGLTPMEDGELAEINILLDARAQARVDALEDRLRDLTALTVEGVSL